MDCWYQIRLQLIPNPPNIKYAPYTEKGTGGQVLHEPSKVTTSRYILPLSSDDNKQHLMNNSFWKWEEKRKKDDT